MRGALALALVAIVAAGAALADVKRRETVPESLWGKWAPSPELCATGDRANIELSAKAYLRQGANCGVRWVSEVPGLDGPIYSAHIACPNDQGGGQARESNVVFVPTRDPNKFSVGADFDNLTDLQRCAPKQ